MLRGVLIGGALGVPLCIVIELGYLMLRYGGLNLGSGSMATFLLLLFVADFGFRGLVFGLIIGTLTAAIALLTRQRLRIGTRSRRVLAVAAVSSFTSGALAWLAVYAALELGATVVEFVYPIAAAIVGGLVAAVTELCFQSSNPDERRSAR